MTCDSWVPDRARPRARQGPLAAVVAVALLPIVLAAASGLPDGQADDKKDKPRLTLRATPLMAFTPARIQLVAELKNGRDDYEPFYCAAAEWDWGDETRSSSSSDCEPYEAGESEIERRFSTTHIFRLPGSYRVQFRLKQKDKTVAMASVTVRISAGLGVGW